jgi:hypothetical protein
MTVQVNGDAVPDVGWPTSMAPPSPLATDKVDRRIRMHFNRFTGATVFHCHIVAHEDNGMMGIIDITKDGRLSKQTQQTLDKMNQEMAGQHMNMGGH